MKPQILIALGREFGSGGHHVAQAIAERLDIQYYSRNFLEEMFKDDPATADLMTKYEERSYNPLLSRRVKGHTNSFEEHLMNMEFDFLREKAENGESFIVVGRCGDVILNKYPHSISVFVLADHDDKVARVMRREQLDERQAIERMRQQDRLRKRFHNTYSRNKWGRADSYDLTINSTRLGIDGTVDVLLQYVHLRTERNAH